ncbi:MAG TPA: hypothetical protein VL595_11655 [Pseudonocardia sp.]|nr:hypothetical protein [Pseudonocardia sp.]
MPTLIDMGWGSGCEQSWSGAVAELVAAAQAFRAALLRVAEEAWPTMDVQAREAAQAASRMFWDAVSGLPAAVGTRRTRKLAILWENAAAMTLWHHRSVYADAEQLGFTLLTQLPEMGVPRGRRWLEFRDANKHAEHLIDRELRSTGQRGAVMRAAEAFNSRREAGSEAALAAAVAAAAADPPVTDTDKTHPHKTTWPARRRRRTGPRDRGPIADQAELRWRIRADLSNLRLEGALIGGPIEREAGRKFEPWLTDTLISLDEPLPVSELQQIADEWRQRRHPYRHDPEWADIIIVDPIPRQPVTRRWRRRHGDEPTPPLSEGQVS